MRYLKKILFLLPFLAVSCGEFAFNEQVQISPYGNFDFSYSWENVEKPDTNMYVLLSRIINTRHYYVELDTEGHSLTDSVPETSAPEVPEDTKPEDEKAEEQTASLGSREDNVPPTEDQSDKDGGNEGNNGNSEDGEGNENQDGNETNPEEQEPEENKKPDVDGQFNGENFTVEPGKYTAVTVSMLQEGSQRIISLNEFKDDNTIDLNKMRLETRIMSDEEVDSMFSCKGYEKEFNWQQLNYAFPFIESIQKNIYMSTEEVVEIGSNMQIPINFAPKNMVQDISLSFSLNTEKGIVIDKVLTEISGIPNQINISKGCTYTDSLYRIVVEPKSIEKKEYEKSFLEEYKVTAKVLGLHPPKDAWQLQGPGLAHFIVFVTYHIRDDKGNMKPVKKIVHGSKNLYNPITEAELMEYDENCKGYRITKNEVELNTHYAFKITHEQLNATNDGGVIDWDDSGDDIEGEL